MLGGLLLLSACARREAPVLTSEPPLPPAAPAPAWLGADWARREPLAWFAPERDLLQTYSPRGAAAPVVLYAHVTPAEAKELGAAPLDRVAQRLAAAMRTHSELLADQPWSGPGFSAARRLTVRGTAPDGVAGRLHGQILIGACADGGLVVCGVLLPAGGDESLIERVLGDVPRS